MKKEVEGECRGSGIERDGVEVVLREEGQSESSAPTVLRSCGGRRVKKAQQKRNGRVVVRKDENGNGSVHEGQYSGAPPFVVPPMQFSIGV